MKKVIITPEEPQTILLSEISPDKIFLAIRDNPKYYNNINLLRYEPTQGWIFRNIDSLNAGHSGHYPSHTAAISGLLKNWTAYQFDSLIEAFKYINSLNLVRSS